MSPGSDTASLPLQLLSMAQGQDALFKMRLTELDNGTCILAYCCAHMIADGASTSPVKHGQADWLSKQFGHAWQWAAECWSSLTHMPMRGTTVTHASLGMHYIGLML